MACMSLQCFEPETCGYVAKGLAFHKFYFDLPCTPPAVKPNVTLADVHVRMLTGGPFPEPFPETLNPKP